jgi:hypothetical protein
MLFVTGPHEEPILIREIFILLSVIHTAKPVLALAACNESSFYLKLFMTMTRPRTKQGFPTTDQTKM